MERYALSFAVFEEALANAWQNFCVLPWCECEVMKDSERGVDEVKETVLRKQGKLLQQTYTIKTWETHFVDTFNLPPAFRSSRSLRYC